MPLVERGPLKGNYLPDYDGGSTVNLLASLINARGGVSPHRELDGLPARSIANSHAIFYIVLDGLGLAQLERHLRAGAGQRFFAKHPHRQLSTVFPATTAAAVTTFDTGASPAEHAILSWFLHLPDLGCVAAVLRTHSRVGTDLVPADFDLRSYFAVPSFVETVQTHRALLSYGTIPDARFGVVGSIWEDRRAYNELDGLVAAVEAVASAPRPSLSYVYWPRYDGLCHEHGCQSAEVAAQFEELDDALARVIECLAHKNATVCVLADHGLVDVAREHCIDLAQVPGFMDCLAMAPSGDQRQMSCFVRPTKVDAFRRIFERELSHACICITGDELLEAGAFGPGKPHESLANRLGDYVLLCRDDYAMIHTPRGFEPLYMPGSHGGMSAAEILIPLYVVRT
jgi:hypothetical protein